VAVANSDELRGLSMVSRTANIMRDLKDRVDYLENCRIELRDVFIQLKNADKLRFVNEYTLRRVEILVGDDE
jgi:hypothetical protein